jgi:alkanesulfonate monooxygenase SsuD/methylene tetrahydromethanopterin reductase-like flavin-dependent oxidoreductase (luciferase family)
MGAHYVNYGHSLEFGTFITPRSDAPAAVVDLAVRSEALGYDLVTFQDHPYMPDNLDAWTLLAWVAGRTERIRLAANVLNLPLRDPAVLARSAASLDLLSGGRLELGLGAGGFPHPIEAMGGERRSPGEAVEALGEAIDVIRQMLGGAGDAVRYRGEHYTLNGAQGGPVPAHEIPIWVGATKPRMLRLIGRVADGWLPTLDRMESGGLRDGNRIIDAAAREAGRDPREIRRLVNISGTFSDTRGGFLDGPPETWVEDLLPLVVEDGVGTFILMTDDDATMTRFAEEVIPALRDATDRALPGELRGQPPRRADVRAKRREGIDYDAIPESLAGDAVEPGDVAYSTVRSTYMRGGAPGLVLRPGSTLEVVEALAFARRNPDVPMSVRSGGHGISGRSTNDGGIVIDLGRMNAIDVLDEATRRVRIEPGARWADVATALAPHGWALSSGDYGGVGVGGLATAGGVGWLARKHALTIDHLREVEMVLADGSVVRASDAENVDLFWAVRGAGANFGIVTSFEFEVDTVGNIGFAQLVHDAGDTAGVLERWGSAIEASSRDVSGEIILGAPRPGQPTVAQTMTVVDSDDPESIIGALQPIANVAPLLDQQVMIIPYAGLMANAAQGYHQGQGEPVGHSGLLHHITPAFAADATRLIQSGGAYFFQIRTVGGAVADVDPDATAYANRAANFQVDAFGSRRRLDPLWEDLRQHFDGMYLSFETDRSVERLHDAFPPSTLRRLRELKGRYDPDNVFRDNFNIAPKSLAGTR